MSATIISLSFQVRYLPCWRAKRPYIPSLLSSNSLIQSVSCIVIPLVSFESGFPIEGQTIGQRLHSSLVRLVLALSRVQARSRHASIHFRFTGVLG